MKYYQLKPGHELSEIGAYPQSLKMTDNYKIDNPDSIWEMDIHSEKPPNLDGIQLDKLAKTTDMLSVVTISSILGLIISDPFKNVLQNLFLPPHRFFEARVYDYQGKAVQKKYYLFRLLIFQNDWINFERSLFTLSKVEENETKYLSIKNAEAFSDLPRNTSRNMRPEMIYLKSNLRFDIFYFHKIAGYFVSERLKSAIEENGLTGIRFEAADFILQEEVQRFNS